MLEVLWEQISHFYCPKLMPVNVRCWNDRMPALSLLHYTTCPSHVHLLKWQYILHVSLFAKVPSWTASWWLVPPNSNIPSSSLHRKFLCAVGCRRTSEHHYQIWPTPVSPPSFLTETTLLLPTVLCSLFLKKYCHSLHLVVNTDLNWAGLTPVTPREWCPGYAQLCLRVA